MWIYSHILYSPLNIETRLSTESIYRISTFLIYNTINGRMWYKCLNRCGYATTRQTILLFASLSQYIRCTFVVILLYIPTDCITDAQQ